jgi:pyrroloquinoline quinone (PQQ) biosynthesis protein C
MSHPTHGQESATVMQRRFAQAEWLEPKIARLRTSAHVEQHPFLQRWLAGDVTMPELHLFAAEHHHAVVALAASARSAAALTEGLLAEELGRYADDQEDYIELWSEFAAATGWTRGSWWYFAEDPLPQTVACSRAWSGETRPLAHHLITIHAIESLLAVLAPRQHDALVDRLGFDERSTRYFSLHAQRSAADAELVWAALTSLLPLTAPVTLLTQVELSYRSYYELLDGVQTLSACPS